MQRGLSELCCCALILIACGGTQDAASSAGGSGGSGGGADGPWRSELYPDDWTPGGQTAAGHRLQDYSYAGYDNGRSPIGTAVVNDVLDVVALGADATGQTDASAAIQQAIDAKIATGGGVVYLPAGSYRCDAPLVIGGSNIVLRGDGPTSSQLFFTATAANSHQANITIGGQLTHGPELALVEDGVSFSDQLAIGDASGLSAGDDIVVGWTITDAFIADHQMTGTWDHADNAFHDQWQPLFRRNIVAIDTSATPHRVTLDVPLRYDAPMRDGSNVRRETGHVEQCGVEGLALGNAVDWQLAWAANQVHVLAFEGCKDCWLRDVASFDPPTAPTDGEGADDHLQSSGILVRNSKRVTIADSELHGSQHKGGGGNGYLFEVRQSNEILFVDLIASGGRHNFIQNWGFGVSGCVWLRVHSYDGRAWIDRDTPGLTGLSEFHHSLALGNLIDSSRFDDGWSIVNRGSYSSYSGHTGTENTMWNTRGEGVLRSRQFGMGYVIGSETIRIETDPELILAGGEGTLPEDWTEGVERAADLQPQSLYEDQRLRRLGL